MERDFLREVDQTPARVSGKPRRSWRANLQGGAGEHRSQRHVRQSDVDGRVDGRLARVGSRATEAKEARGTDRDGGFRTPREAVAVIIRACFWYPEWPRGCGANLAVSWCSPRRGAVSEQGHHPSSNGSGSTIRLRQMQAGATGIRSRQRAAFSICGASRRTS